MKLKLIWTVAWLVAWMKTRAHTGINTALVVFPHGRIDLIMQDGFHSLPPRWRPWRYYGLLDYSARLLHEANARVRRRVDAAHDEFCRGLDTYEGKGRI